MAHTIMHAPSSVTSFEWKGRRFFVKRDDLIDPLFSGNKYRKFHTLLQTPASRYTKVISYGGNQSNAMLSLARLCQIKGWHFDYYTKRLSAQAASASAGNLSMALEMGMQLHEVEHSGWEATVRALHGPQLDGASLVVAQGGADPLAQEGVKQLGDEIAQWQAIEGVGTLNIVTPSGTGTTAYYLAKAVPKATVYTTPVIGELEYLLEQWSALGPIPENLCVLETAEKYRFGKPYEVFANIYKELNMSGIEFDLLYAPKMWLALWENLSMLDGTILYVHSGGVSGNRSMRERYRRKGWL